MKTKQQLSLIRKLKALWYNNYICRPNKHWYIVSIKGVYQVHSLSYYEEDCINTYEATWWRDVRDDPKMQVEVVKVQLVDTRAIIGNL